MIVEIGGNGTVGANSYTTQAYADTYHTLYGNTDWAGLTADKEAALIQGTRSIDLLYGPLMLSFKRVNSASPLLFPRMPFFDNNQQLLSYVIPVCLQDAVCEVALMYMKGIDIFPLKNIDGNIKVNKVKVGEIEVESQYAGKSGELESFNSFRKVDLILYPIIRQPATSIILGR